MGFVPNTPESYIGRSDSKNEATTCRGVTSSGRPCRRPNTASQSDKPAERKKAQRLRVADPADPDLYCWQHRDQAAQSAHSSPAVRPSNGNGPVSDSRESLDGLMAQLGIEDEQEREDFRKNNGKQQHRPHSAQPAYNGGSEKIDQPAAAAQRPSSHKRKEINICCCITIPLPSLDFDDEPEPAPRPQTKPAHATPSAAARPSTSKLPSNQHLAPPSNGAGGRPSPSHQSSAQSNVSQTSEFLSLIPGTASPQTASELMRELAKPPSAGDEPGYIYIFWLTPESEPAQPPADAARSLLTPPQTNSRGLGADARRGSDVLETFANRGKRSRSPGGGDDASSTKTVLWKIGRASNVQRRMNEWKRQCGYNLSLVRYYPHVSQGEASAGVRKMPHSHKVERMIHIELAGLGMRVSDREKWTCDSCGKAHKEWFEVEASRAGVELVDEVCQRWSDWDEGRG